MLLYKYSNVLLSATDLNKIPEARNAGDFLFYHEAGLPD